MLKEILHVAKEVVEREFRTTSRGRLVRERYWVCKYVTFSDWFVYLRPFFMVTRDPPPVWWLRMKCAALLQ